MPLQHAIWVTPIINIYLKQSLVSAGRHQTHVSSIFSGAFPTPAMAGELAAAGTLPCFVSEPPAPGPAPGGPACHSGGGPGARAAAVLVGVWGSTHLWWGSSLRFPDLRNETHFS